MSEYFPSIEGVDTPLGPSETIWATSETHIGMRGTFTINRVAYRVRLYLHYRDGIWQRGDKDDWSGFMVFKRNAPIERYERSPYPVRFEGDHFAAGCGRDFAMAAMHLGKSAREAVEVAMALDNCCGNGIDTLSL